MLVHRIKVRSSYNLTNTRNFHSTPWKIIPSVLVGLLDTHHVYSSPLSCLSMSLLSHSPNPSLRHRSIHSPATHLFAPSLMNAHYEPSTMMMIATSTKWIINQFRSEPSSQLLRRYRLFRIIIVALSIKIAKSYCLRELHLKNVSPIPRIIYYIQHLSLRKPQILERWSLLNAHLFCTSFFSNIHIFCCLHLPHPSR